ncbi:hypothetical protein DPMN_180663 [Dreissena polymorpha]|uniref:Uncharacterized protein n=1 Tax=Dreissena polymorpha TaxID=45954 RepID=A0A9D4EGD4_DREPO|nr:hypothetical protein DPMN_180663 [Dreissena polymorpha]
MIGPTTSKLTCPILNRSRYIIGTNVLTKFHADCPINLANIAKISPATVLVRKNAPPPAIITTYFLTKIHKDLTKNVSSRVLTTFYNSHINKMPPRPYIITTNPLTKFYEDRTETATSGFPEDWTKTVTSRVLTRKHAQIITTNVLTKFNDDWTIGSIFKLVQDIIRTHENVTPPGGHVFQKTETIFKLIQDIIRKNVLTKFHEDWTINETSRVLTIVDRGVIIEHRVLYDGPTSATQH